MNITIAIYRSHYERWIGGHEVVRGRAGEHSLIGTFEVI